MSTEYPKKYWWIVLIVVPLAGTLIGALITVVIPYFFKDKEVIYISRTEFSGDMYFYSLSAIEKEIEKEYEQTKGDSLKDEKLKQKIERATNLVIGGDYAGAIPLFEELAQQVPLSAIYNNLGVLYASIKNYEDARQAYEKAIEQNPNDQPVNLNIGLLDENQGKTEEAIRHFKAAPDLKVAKARAEVIEKKIKEEEIKKEEDIKEAEVKKVIHTIESEPNNEEMKKVIHTIESEESEPNNDIFKSNLISLETKVQCEIADNSDTDFFSFKTPPLYRDFIKITVENRSTTLMPYLFVFNSEKSQIGKQSKVTPGANLTYSFSVAPDLIYYIQISGRGGSSGAYKTIIEPLKAYDKYERNDDILHAKPISLGTSINAGIMDGFNDPDFYQFKSLPQVGAITVSIENLSTTLLPRVSVFNSEKSQIGKQSKVTPGANLTYSFSVEPDLIYYIQISGRGGSSGAYRLTVKQEIERP